MPAASSKNPEAPSRWPWYWALGSLFLCLSLGLVWWQEAGLPWKEEVRSINRKRGELVRARLLEAGTEPERAEARALELAREPPRIRELRPAAFDRTERCLTCHQGIEDISPSHPAEAVGCVVCHGGQPLGLTRETAHAGLWGRNPSLPALARSSCGRQGGDAGGPACHGPAAGPGRDMPRRVENGIMATMAGVIAGVRVGWGAQNDWPARYATAMISDPERSPAAAAQAHTLAGLDLIPPFPTLPGPDARGGWGLAGLAEDHWRKFCARCHLRAQRDSGKSVHGQGCAACHGQREEDGRYHGDDPALDRESPGHASRHTLKALPEEEACRRCHNRSGRIGLNYQGLMEDEGGGAPWPDGNPREDLSGGRSVRRLLPDVHAQAGLTCADCHTPWEIMGDGHIYGRMRFQTEIRCTTCHGDGYRAPETAPAGEDELYQLRYGPLKEARPLEEGETLVKSAKGRLLPQVRHSRKGLLLHAKSKPGKVHPVRIVTGDPRHTLPGHKRLACQACHSRWTPQCYGCHDYRLNGVKMWDYATGKPTPGGWRETRDLYRFAEPVLGVDSRGMIRPYAPGCQVMLTELDPRGNPIPGRIRQVQRDNLAGGSLVSTPISPHTTRTEVRPCEECHLSPRTLGLGGGPRALGDLASRPVSDLAGAGFGADWEALLDNLANPTQGNTHQGARPLNREELTRAMSFGRCLPCHRKPEDPVLADAGRARTRIAPGGDLYDKHRQWVEKALK